MRPMTHPPTHLMRLSLLASTALLSLAMAMPATAQTLRPQTEAEKQAAETQLDPVVVTTDRLGRSLQDQENHVSVVSGEELRAGDIHDLEGLTRHLPGVAPSRTVSADPFGGTSGVQIRGVEGNRIQFQIDGGRIPERIMDGSRDYLDFNFTRQAEIVRGPASVLWGADALGGVVALRTITADDLIAPGDTRGGQLTSGYSSADRSGSVALAFGQRLSDSTSLVVAHARGTNHELELKHAPADGGAWGCTRPVAFGSVDCGKFNPLLRTSNRTLVKLEHKIDENQKVSFSFDRLARKSEIDILTSLSSTVIGNHRVRDIKRTRYAIDYEGTFSSPWMDSLKATLSASPSGYRQHGQQLSILTSGERQVQHDRLRYSEDFFELDIQANKRFELAGAQHNVTWGFDGDRTKTTYEVTRNRVNLATGVNTDIVAGGFNFADGTTQRADLYIQDEITLLGGRLSVTPGLRLAHYRMDPRINSTVVTQDPSLYENKRETNLLKSLGATWRLDDSHSVWAHYGEGFKMPTFQQLFTSSTSGSYDLVPAPWLKPEKVKNLEVGVRGDYGNAVWSLNAFKADYTDFIESFWFVPDTNDISYRNLSAVRTWGIEAEGAWQVNSALKLNGSLAWMQGRARATAGAAETVHVVPPLSASLGAEYHLAQYDLTLGANLYAASSVKSKPGNFSPSGYGVVDVSAKWAVSERASLNLTVNNVFDRAYYTQGAASSSLSSTAATMGTVPPGMFTGVGRSLALNLDLRF